MKKYYVILLLVSISLLLLLQCSLGERADEACILLDKYRKIVLVGSSETVHATTAIEQDLIWRSSDDSIVTVSGSGELTGISSGSAIIDVDKD